jgi:pSer/pThr/pTyr-binding forkhead associated (FHA) protein
MSQPSHGYILTLEFKGRELGRWQVLDTAIKIGRTADNHIVIDNLSVSRLHATVEMSPDGLTIRDHGSANGTRVNGVLVDHAKLSHGDIITIGKHNVVCRVAAPDGSVAQDPVLFESTLLAGADSRPGPVANPAMLTETSSGRQRTYTLDRGLMIIGSDEAADIVVLGRGIAPYHAEIRFLGGHYSVRHLDGRARVKVDGEAVKEQELTDGCTIVVGDFSFSFAHHANVSIDS